MPHLRVLELYAGIGGMHISLEIAKQIDPSITYEVVHAIDNNGDSLQVYGHNFGQKHIKKNNIESLGDAFWSNLNTNTWMMSPPCQPYTRQGLQKGSHDPRALSFIYVLEKLQSLSFQKRPEIIILENVQGFESSDSREMLVTTLQKSQFSYREFLLSPIYFGLPNFRTRYFLVARKIHPSTPSPFPDALPTHPSSPPLFYIPSFEHTDDYLCPIHPLAAYLTPSLQQESQETPLEVLLSYREQAEDKTTLSRQEMDLSSLSKRQRLRLENAPKNTNALQTNKTGEVCLRDLVVSVEQMRRWWSSVDLVLPEEVRSNCFTSSYGKNPSAATGSLLLVHPSSKKDMDWRLRKREEKGDEGSEDRVNERGEERREGCEKREEDRVEEIGEEREENEEGEERGRKRKREGKKEKKGNELKDFLTPEECVVRYFSPEEMARLHGFVKSFSFPPGASARQHMGMIGNSLNSKIVSFLVRFAVQVPFGL